jgi:enoyl-CoA hydratase
MSVSTERRDDILIVTIDRPEARNAVDTAHAAALFDAFVDFARDETLNVAVLAGVPGAFCAGFDLKQAASGVGDDWFARHDLGPDFRDPAEDMRPGPMGPTRLLLPKPVIAAVTGPAVAGGMELALWADLRVMEESAYMGVFCRRWGVPLIDGGTIRLPRIVGHGRAMDLVLTGRKADAGECLAIGLANRVVADGAAVDAAVGLAREIARYPQACMRADRLSAIRQWSLDPGPALANEWKSVTVMAGEGQAGAARFAGGKGRGGNFGDL